MSMFSRKPVALFVVLPMSVRKPRKIRCDEWVNDSEVPHVDPRHTGRCHPAETANRFSLRNAPSGLWLASSGTAEERAAPSRGCGLAGSWRRMVRSPVIQLLRSSAVFAVRQRACPRRYEVRSSLKPCRSRSTLARDFHEPLEGTPQLVEAPPVP